MEANVRLEHELPGVETENTVHATLELAAPALPTTHPRPRRHLALISDRSGSMQGEKLATTKDCAAFLLGRLASTGEFAVVAYDDGVTLVAPLGPPTRSELLPLIASIPPGGQTNLSGGWLKGVESSRPRVRMARESSCCSRRHSERGRHPLNDARIDGEECLAGATGSGPPHRPQRRTMSPGIFARSSRAW